MYEKSSKKIGVIDEHLDEKIRIIHVKKNMMVYRHRLFKSSKRIFYKNVSEKYKNIFSVKTLHLC